MHKVRKGVGISLSINVNLVINANQGELSNTSIDLGDVTTGVLSSHDTSRASVSSGLLVDNGALGCLEDLDVSTHFLPAESPTK